MKKRKNLEEDISKLFWDIPMDSNMIEIEKRIKKFIGERIEFTDDPPLFFPGTNKYLIIKTD